MIAKTITCLLMGMLTISIQYIETVYELQIYGNQFTKGILIAVASFALCKSIEDLITTIHLSFVLKRTKNVRRRR